MSDEDKQIEAAAEVLQRAGFGSLGEKPPMEQVGAACDVLGVFLAGADPFIRELVTAAAASAIRISGFCSYEQAVKIIKASIGQAAGARADDEKYQTFGVLPSGEVIVELVQDKRELRWVIARPPGTRSHPLDPSVAIVSQIADRVMWPRITLPWKGIPHARDVKHAWGIGVDGRALFLELTDVFRHAPPHRLMILPEPAGVWAALLALWVMGTYLQHWFKYYSVLLLEGPPERGKSRLGNAAVFLARRGYATQSPTEAVIFRNRARHMISLFIDVRDLPKLMDTRQGIEELILSGMERGKVVQRVTRQDAPTPIGEMKNFEPYGPLILASNRDVAADHPLASRSLRIPMPEAGSQAVEPALNPDDALVLSLRAKLVAWAAQVIAEGTEAPTVARVLTGRLHDIASPLLVMARLVYPECIPALIALLQGTEKVRRVDAPDSWEGRVVGALAIFGREGLIGYKELLDRVNDGVQDDDVMTARKLGWVLKHLGLETDRHGKGRRQHRYVVHPGADTMRELCDHYRVVPLETTETTETTETGTASNDPGSR